MLPMINTILFLRLYLDIYFLCSVMKVNKSETQISDHIKCAQT